jgi:histidinol-phosphatase (PHP family)
MIPQLVSIHGGHSGQFCNHAQNTLEQVVQAYIAKGFAWVGLTEHMPPADSRFLYPEEQQSGLDVAAMQARFGRYMAEGRRLQRKYADRLEIFVGVETETCTGSLAAARALVAQYRPDYVVGGVHHVDDIPFDYSPAEYARAVAAAGDMDALYCRYFDLQYEMIQTLQPKVVAHFDLIRLFDADYPLRLKAPGIQARVSRNLQLIRQLDLILDFNVAALRKGATEPYLSRPILEQVHRLGIAVVPADDSHGADMAGAYIGDGIAILDALGFSTAWTKPLAR